MTDQLDALLAEIRACRLCEAVLPLGPRPVLRARATAKVLIIGQAPGTKVHVSGVPWNDASGQRLRDWLAMPPELFYDESKIAIVPAGFCYPGRDPKGGDLPPRPECGPLWHPRIRPLLPEIRLTLLVGGSAQRLVLGEKAGNVFATVARWREFPPEILPLPHPSWRTLNWERRNPWFGEEFLPALRHRLADLFSQC